MIDAVKHFLWRFGRPLGTSALPVVAALVLGAGCSSDKNAGTQAGEGNGGAARSAGGALFGSGGGASPIGGGGTASGGTPATGGGGAISNDGGHSGESGAVRPDGGRDASRDVGDASSVPDASIPDATSDGPAVPACFVNDQCPSNETCSGSGTAKVCVPKEDYCDDATRCVHRTGGCIAHRCTPPLPMGALCFGKTEQCIDGTWCKPVDSPNEATATCVVGLSNGALCTHVDPVTQQTVGADLALACPDDAPCQQSDQIGDLDWYCFAPGSRNTRLCMYGCDASSYCTYDVPPPDGSGSGMCVPRLGLGDNCFANGDCADGLACGLYGCVEAPVTGAPCRGADGGAGELFVPICRTGDFCAADGICRHQAGYGKACSEAPCASTLRCVNAAVNGICR